MARTIESSETRNKAKIRRNFCNWYSKTKNRNIINFVLKLMALSFSLIFFSLSYLWSITLFLSKFIFLQYDCSSADINPIGSLNKQDIREFLRWAAIHLGYSSLADIEAAPPTAELEPIRSDYVQVVLYFCYTFQYLLFLKKRNYIRSKGGEDYFTSRTQLSPVVYFVCLSSTEEKSNHH
jgi:hypothetical protein